MKFPQRGKNWLRTIWVYRYDYLLIRRDAFIARLRQSESGQEYLDNAYRLTLTKPDRQALRENFGKGGMIGGKK